MYSEVFDMFFKLTLNPHLYLIRELKITLYIN